MTTAYAKTLKLDATFNPTVTGNVYAQPLYIAPGPPGNGEAFVVATESNHIAAIDAASGTVIWDQTYGAPVTSGLACGNITPLGITGTPVIDAASRTIFFDTMVSTGGPKHMIHAVSLDNMGAEVSGWPVDVNAKVSGFDSSFANQRGALALLNGVLYVPYGGLDGDCGTYYGWVVGVNIATQAVTTFATGSKMPMGGASASKGGIWAVGGVASDGQSSLFVSTGNTQGAGSTWSGGEAVLRLGSPGPTFSNTLANAFYPGMWASWDSSDADLGGSNPVVFDLPSDGGVQHLVVALGKDGNLYLLDRDNLRGADGQLSMTAVATQTGAAYYGSLSGAAAVYTTSNGTYVAFHVNANAPGYAVVGCPSGQSGGNLGVARVTPGVPPRASVVWCATETNLGSPMVTTTGSAGQVVVWDANTHLYGYDGDTGMKVFDGTSFTLAGGLHYYNTPIGAHGRIAVATAGPGHLYVFKP
jgi:outer membrane protein assembly factor BamB